MRAAPPPHAGLAPSLAAALAGALQDLGRAFGPEVPEGSTWIREVRIAARRLRTLLAPLVLPRDRRGIEAVRRRLRRLLDGLSAGRDREVAVAWLARDLPWEPAELEARAGLGGGGGWDPAAAAGQELPAPPPGAPLPGGPSGVQARWGLLRAAAQDEVLELGAEVAEAVRGFLPEELHRPPARGFPGLVLGEPAAEGLPRPRLLRLSDPDAADRAAARGCLEHAAWQVTARLPALGADAPEPAAIHELRRDARRMRYLVEALEAAFPGLGKLGHSLQRFAWLLGQLQDRQVVRELLAGAAPGAPGVRVLLARLEAEERDLLAEARELAARKVSAAGLQRALRCLERIRD